MNLPVLILGVASLVLALMIGDGRPVIAATAAPALEDGSGQLAIRSLQRSPAAGGRAAAVRRDPFAIEPARAPVSDDVAPPAAVPAAALASVAAPAFPAFRVLGKQQDDDGWAVFISEPGKQGNVWVVREGESFNEHFVVAKLAPPRLVIRRLPGRQSQTYDIGTEEIEP